MNQAQWPNRFVSSQPSAYYRCMCDGKIVDYNNVVVPKVASLDGTHPPAFCSYACCNDHQSHDCKCYRGPPRAA